MGRVISPRQENPRMTTRERQSRKAARAKATKRWMRTMMLRSAIVGVVLLGLLAAAYHGWFKESTMEERFAAYTTHQVQRLSEVLGVTVTEVAVEGRDKAPLNAVGAAIAVEKGDSMLLLDLETIKAQLEQIGWVRQATVSRQFPGKLYVVLEEKVPVALWQKNGTLHLIDREGFVLSDSGVGDYPNLPVVVGETAPMHTFALLKMLSSQPELYAKVSSAIHVGGRRWNVRFYNGVEVKLPEENPREAWSFLFELQKTKQILDRDITTLDLRVPDRVFIGLPEGTPAPGAPEGKKPGEAT